MAHKYTGINSIGYSTLIINLGLSLQTLCGNNSKAEKEHYTVMSMPHGSHINGLE